MNKHLSLILIICILLSYSLLSQSRQFSGGGEDNFLQNIEKIYSGIMDKKALKDVMLELSTFWNTEADSELKGIIMKTSDLINFRKGRPVDYQNYLNTVMTLTKSDQTSQSKNIWHGAIINLLENTKIPLRNVLKIFEHTQNLINENIIYSTAAIKWTAERPSYRFSYSDSLIVDFSRTRISCISRKDSISVLNTSGSINLHSGIWQGKSGEIDWTQCGFPANMVNASFDEYEINMSTTEIEIENVTFQNLFYFNYTLKGKLNHRVSTFNKPESSTWPRFVSYEQRYDIKSIHDKLNFEGGFSQQGARFLGSGTDKNPAIINVFRDDKVFISAKSQYFILRKDQIISNNAEITILLDTGYIYHPGLTFRYMDETKDIYLIREGEGLSNSSFFNTYHNVNMDVQLIKWNMNETEIEFRMIDGAAENYAFFESTAYFREEFYNRLQGIDAIHPLQGLLNFSRAVRQEKFTARDYARFLGIAESPVRQQIIGLSFHGFIGYNTNTDTVEIRERLKDYLLYRAGFKDYDVIRFKSITPTRTPNAIFDLKNYDIALNGVSVVSISDNQNVAFFPKDDKLLLKKDRNFNFDGTIAAGMLSLFGNSFHFNYQDFRVDLQVIDSLAMRIESRETDYIGRPLLRKVENTIQELSGYLEIDRTDNKSGKESYPEYPRLTSITDSYVYYDRADIQQGAYEREVFYFRLDPFEIDSINKLTFKNIAFEGELISGIFPNLSETLIVREDFSLGFKKESPPDGYPIYGGKANFTNTVDLSNKGLKGDGMLKYITSVSESEDFTFLPNETKGLAKKFVINAQETGVEFPDVSGSFNNITFIPAEDRLVVDSNKDFFTIHNGENKFLGALSVKPTGLEGKGTLDMTKATLAAASMNLGHHSVTADNADFNLVNEKGSDEVNFKTNNLLAHIDFKTREGKFTSRESNNKVEFTENRYISYINDFSWDIDNNNIMLGSRGSVGNRFVSTLRRQDSLDWVAPVAIYDVQNRLIKAEEVKNIYVADVNMFLNDGKITIRKDALMDPLDSVKIILNDSIHSFYDARVNISGKKSYTASGKYDFLNGNDEVKTIKFSEIEVNKDVKTVAKGTIMDNEMFTFDSHFTYKGDVTLTSGNTLLNFKGGAQMLHPCSTLGPQEYVRFDSEIDPKNVLIPIGSTVQNYDYDNIYKAFYLNRDSNLVYTSFFENRRFHSDVPLMTTEGFLYYKDSILSFVIEPELKMAYPDTLGTVMRFHENGCLVTADGLINLGLDFEHIKMPASGNGVHDRNTGETKFLTLFAADFMLDPKSVDIMVSTIRNTDYDKAGNPDNDGTLKRLSEWIGLPQASKLVTELTEYEKLTSLPADRQYTMVFDSLVWEWNREARSYFAEGQAFLLWMKDKQVNREVHVKGKISFSRAGNTFDLYVEAAPEVYFFFSYRVSTSVMMSVLSSVEDFNTNIVALKEEERVVKPTSGGRQYNLVKADNNRFRQVLRVFSQRGEATEEEEEE